MKLSEIPGILRAIGVKPVKSLGQNFLHDRNLARLIVDHAELSAEDYVIEIGPGLGALTEIALQRGAGVLAIEKDARLANFLRDKFSAQPLEVLHLDALKFDARELYAHARVKLIGNLPYYVSSQLLLKFLEYPSPISLSLLMLQREMAKRLTATPTTSDYGALTLQLQLHYHVEYLRTVPPNVFLPQPEVDSALVRIRPRNPLELPFCDYNVFQNLVRTGFSQRRKQLGKLLRPQVADWEATAKELNFKPHARAEELSLEQWISLTNSVAPIPTQPVDAAVEEHFPVVDREDRIIGRAPRGEVHANNSLHRAVHVLVFNPVGEVFLQKRSRSKDRHPLAWDSSAAGHVIAGEEYDAAAKREVIEELGVEIDLERVAKLPAGVRTDQEFIWLYRGASKKELKPNRSEIEAGEYFPAQVVDGWVKARPQEFAPAFIECWKAWREAKL